MQRPERPPVSRVREIRTHGLKGGLPMRARWAAVCLAALPASLMFCSESKPPSAGDGDSAVPLKFPEAGTYEVVAPELDAGSPGLPVDGGVANARDFHGLCDQGKLPVWHYFDFQTHTPAGSAITLRAQSAATQSGLDGAPQVQLATISGPDITVWTGVDVDGKLVSIGQKSLAWLRVTSVLYSSDAGAPAINASRQLYDCILAQ